MIEVQAQPITADLLRSLALQSGADDAGVVAVGRAELDSQRDDLLSFYPWAKTLLSFVCRMNREPIRALPRSVANNEFHHTGHDVDEVARSVVRELESRGVRASSPAMGFPMEMERFPGKLWTVSHKPVAVAAGLGQIGIHRNLIHPKFGNFVLLGTVVIDAVVEEQAEATIIIRDKKLEVKLGHHGTPTLRVWADTDTWLGFLAREKGLFRALITGRIRMKGNPKWLIRFGKCFPS